MTAFRFLLTALATIILAYTAVVLVRHGMTLYPIFFGDIAALTWPGQFNLDFLGFLVLSGLWIAWRHRFSPAGLALGFGGFMLGTPYLCIYLLIASRQVHGDVPALLLGPTRAGAPAAAADSLTAR